MRTSDAHIARCCPRGFCQKARQIPSATLALAAVPGLGAPTSVAPDPGGRYLHVRLQ